MDYIVEFFHYLESQELSYVVLIVMLFILPRLISRFGIPVGLGAFILGYISSNYLGIFSDHDVISTSATLGISALFLYAGLEVNFNELKQNIKVLSQHVLIRSLMIGILTLMIISLFSSKLQIAAIISLALLTPSTGFIIDMLPTTQLSDEQKKWIKTKAIGAEILALLLLLLFQAETQSKAIFSFTVLIGLVFLLPAVFQWVSKRVSVTSTGADFSFLLLLAVVTGTITKKLGAYYLVGAFLVGFTVNFYKKNILKEEKNDFENTAKFFSSFFMPFYFFYAGLKLDSSVFTIQAFLLGAILILVILPVRVYSIVWHRKIAVNETTAESLPIAISLLPTLVFGLVLVEVLRNTGLVENYILGGLIVYTMGSTIIPSIILNYIFSRKDLLLIGDTEKLLEPKDMISSSDGRTL
jgi:Kef-type K+ transport system membrane component KefB